MAEVPNEYLLHEIRENRKEIKEVKTLVAGKVSRSELIGWLGGTAGLLGLWRLILVLS